MNFHAFWCGWTVAVVFSNIRIGQVYGDGLMGILTDYESTNASTADTLTAISNIRCGGLWCVVFVGRSCFYCYRSCSRQGFDYPMVF